MRFPAASGYYPQFSPDFPEFLQSESQIFLAKINYRIPALMVVTYDCSQLAGC